jgi:hypothetical protein
LIFNLSTIHVKCYNQTIISSSVAHPHLEQLQSAPGGPTFSIHSVILSQA